LLQQGEAVQRIEGEGGGLAGPAAARDLPGTGGDDGLVDAALPSPRGARGRPGPSGRRSGSIRAPGSRPDPGACRRRPRAQARRIEEGGPIRGQAARRSNPSRPAARPAGAPDSAPEGARSARRCRAPAGSGPGSSGGRGRPSPRRGPCRSPSPDGRSGPRGGGGTAERRSARLAPSGPVSQDPGHGERGAVVQDRRRHAAEEAEGRDMPVGRHAPAVPA
jgi:hypothetical protein